MFKRNIEDAKQTRALLEEATEFCVPHAVRCVDVEGGTVNRLRDALAPLPSAQAVGAAERDDSPRSPRSEGPTGHPTVSGKSKKLSLAREHGELIARAVKAFGFNTTLAPVVDLGLPESAAGDGIAVRGGDVRRKSVAYAREFLAGLAAQGVAGCGKHFPGLGAGTLDSHFVTPRDSAHLEADCGARTCGSYRELHRDAPMVMVNHAAYPDKRAAIGRRAHRASGSGKYCASALGIAA